MMKTVIITAFEPFAGAQKNGSASALRAAAAFGGNNDCGDKINVIPLTLPVVYGRCADILEEKMKQYRPDAVLCFGQAAGRGVISVEHRAVNSASSATPDEAGVIAENEIIIPDGAQTLYTALPAEDIISALTAVGIGAELSESAGEYVCNYLFYRLLAFRSANGYPFAAGFIHVPAVADAAVTMPGDMITRAAELCIKTVARRLSTAE